MSATAAQPLDELLRSWLAAPGADPEGGRISSSARLPLPVSYAPVGAEEPGRFPFTRGLTERMYLERLWVMGQYSGYASPAETNARFKQLLADGQSGISIALDLPTQMGMDPDDERAQGEVGKVGVPLSNVEDLLGILDGLPFDEIRQIRTSANAIGPIFAAFMIVALEELGVEPSRFRLLLQNDPLKEFAARGTFIFPPAASLELAVDVIEHFALEHPHWEPIEFCGYHMRDAGGTAVQEVAFATVNGLAYLDAAVVRGVDIRGVTGALFLFLAAGVDVFEEAAKLRAARRLWARLLHERYGVPRDEAKINLFVYTLGGALVAQEPINNAVRVTCETLAAVLGGAQTLATSSFDEALGLPSPAAARLALRTQQIVAHESGATTVVDPLGGSYYVEDLTNRIEAEIVAAALRVVELGGAVAGLDSGYVAAELAESAYEYQRQIESGERPQVGVNVHRVPAQDLTETFRAPEQDQRHQVERVEGVRRRRDGTAVVASLAALQQTAKAGRNTIPALIVAARARATLGEIVDTLKGVYGAYDASRTGF